MPTGAVAVGTSATTAPNGWSRILHTVDLAIRLSAVIVVLMLGMAMLLLVSIMATDTGTATAMAAGLAIFVGGLMVFTVIVFLAILPGWFVKRIPGPKILGQVLVRIPAYLVGTLGMALLIRQIWQVAIPDLLRHAPW